jgi:hypothetical protein
MGDQVGCSLLANWFWDWPGAGSGADLLEDMESVAASARELSPLGRATPQSVQLLKGSHTNQNDWRDARASTPRSAVHSRASIGPSGVNGARVLPAHVLWGALSPPTYAAAAGFTTVHRH